MILVCGGAGYIGSHMVRALLSRGEDVSVADNLQTGHRKALPPEARFYHGDLRDPDFMDQVCRETAPEAVMHFAANSQVGESVLNPLKYFNNNLHGTEVLLSAMVKSGVRLIVFSSSAAVYGEPHTPALRESDPTVPTAPYGETKLVMEKMMKWAAAAHDLKFVSLRYFNVAGASPDGLIGEDHRPESHLIPLALLTALKKRAGLDIFGDDYDTPDGTCLRDYIQVSDLAEAHLLALDHLRRGGADEIFNLGGDQGSSVREVIKAAEMVTGLAIPAQVSPRRPGDPARLVADSAKARGALGWRPRFTRIEDIIQTAWNWHKRQPDGYGG
jgi:UDP-glucose 4-epimerase